MEIFYGTLFTRPLEIVRLAIDVYELKISRTASHVVVCHHGDMTEVHCFHRAHLMLVPLSSKVSQQP